MVGLFSVFLHYGAIAEKVSYFAVLSAASLFLS